jgi:hypothetical protein
MSLIGWADARRVTKLLADIVLIAPPDEQSALLADILAKLGSLILEEREDADPTKSNPRHSSHQFNMFQ